eukprot:263061_1
MMFKSLLLFLWLECLYLTRSLDLSKPVNVFERRLGGYECFRIPSLLYIAEQNILFAFAEARKYSCNDHGYVDLSFRKSYDLGHTWSNLTIIYSNSSNFTNKNTIGNPVPIYDEITKTIIMLFCKNNKQIYITKSDDFGLTWTIPIALSINNPNWPWVATGPPGGLVIEINDHATRLIVPIHTSKGNLLYSDDHGQTWNISESFGGDQFTPDESQAILLSNGSIFINSRIDYNESYLRLGTIANMDATNGNTVTFDNSQYIYDLRDVVGGCEGSMVGGVINKNNIIYYSGVTPDINTFVRYNLTVHISNDNANTWKYLLTIQESSAGYSSLQQIGNETIAILYERDLYEFISFATFQQI